MRSAAVEVCNYIQNENFLPFTLTSADIMEPQLHKCYLFSDLSPNMMPISVRCFS